jgi:translation elongation factor EF-4
MKYDIVVEDFGGDVQSSLISAKKGLGVDDLLEKVLLQVSHPFPFLLRFNLLTIPRPKL